MRSALSLIVFLAIGSSDALAAQLPPNEAATAARNHFRVAGTAIERGDSGAALAHLDSAAKVWPTQGAYPRAYARLAGRLGRVQLAVSALHALTTLGVEWSAEDPAFQRIANDPSFQAAVRENHDATTPFIRSTVLWEVGDTSFVIEGVATDTVTGRWFVSSMRSGAVRVRERDGRVREFVAAGTAGLDSAYGMAVDHRRGLLWVAAKRLYGFDLASGAHRHTIELPAVEGGRQLGDVIVTARGTLYTSDSRHPSLFRIPAGPVPARIDPVVTGHPLFRSLQGMVPNASESGLYLADYSHGLLFVSLANGVVSPVRGPEGISLLGIDGLSSGGRGRLIAVQNGAVPVRVSLLELDRSGTRVASLEVIDRPPLAPGEATLGVRVGRSFIYVGTVPAVLRSLDLPTQ